MSVSLMLKIKVAADNKKFLAEVGGERFEVMRFYFANNF